MIYIYDHFPLQLIMLFLSSVVCLFWEVYAELCAIKTSSKPNMQFITVKDDGPPLHIIKEKL